MKPETLSFIESCIKTIPDYPKPGILFRDITSLVEHPQAFKATIDLLVEHYRHVPLDKIVGTEARGFIFGAPVAAALGLGFVPVRKPGKLPARTLSLDYALEYGNDRLQIHADALPPGARVIVVDDVLATGGTLKAALALTRQQGADVVGAAVLLELGFLEARARWTDPAPLRATAIF